MGRNTEITYFQCPECLLEFPIPRKKERRREKGHIKDIYCPKCCTTTKMIQKSIK